MQGFGELESAHQAHAARAKEAFDVLAQEAAALQQRQGRYEALQVGRHAAHSSSACHSGCLLLAAHAWRSGQLCMQPAASLRFLSWLLLHQAVSIPVVLLPAFLRPLLSCFPAPQSRLLNASESLLDQSQDMASLLHVLMSYQAKGNSILSQLQGNSVSLHDVLLYTVAMCIPLIFITYPSDVRLLLLAGVLACWGVERAVMQHYMMLFGGFGSQQAAGDSIFLGPQDVKVAVRLLMLGGTLGVVVWLLLKRRAAHNSKEAIFQAIQQSVRCPLAMTTVYPMDTQ
jgi:hypothetical protein